jgi:hypothetical protein
MNNMFQILLLLLLVVINVGSEHVAISIDSGQVHIDIPNLTNASNLSKYINQHIYRDHILYRYFSKTSLNYSVVCGESEEAHGTLVHAFDWCYLSGAIIADTSKICICLQPTTSPHPSTPIIVGNIHISQNTISWDSIHAIISHQSRIIDSWSVTLHGKHPPVDRIDYIPSMKEFNEKWFNLGLPVIIENMLDDWNAINQWTTNFFKNKFGSLNIHIRDPMDPKSNVVENHKVTVKMSEYMDFLEDSIKTEKYHQRHMVGMLNNFYHHKKFRQLLLDDTTSEPLFFDQLPSNTETGWKDLYFLQNAPMPWIGPKGTHTPLHHDIRSSFNCQIRGEKRWQLIHTRQRNLLTIDKINDNYCLENMDERQLWEVDHQLYPKFKRLTIWNTTLSGGEAMFIPAGLFHDVQCLTKYCITLSLVHFNQFMRKKEHQWVSKGLFALGASQKLSKTLTMGNGYGVDKFKSKNNVLKCPTEKDINESIEKYKTNDKKLNINTRKKIWTIVNTTPKKIFIKNINNEVVFHIEGKTSKDVPLKFSHLSLLFGEVYNDGDTYGTIIAILFKENMTRVEKLIGRSIIKPCKMAPSTILKHFYQLHYSIKNNEIESLSTIKRLSSTGLDITLFGLFVPLNSVLEYTSYEYVRAAYELGVNHFHLDLTSLLSIMRNSDNNEGIQQVKMLGIEFKRIWENPGIRDHFVLVCHVSSVSKKTIATTLMKIFHLIGAQYCDVLVTPNDGDTLYRKSHTISSLDAKWFIKHQLALFVGEKLTGSENGSKSIVSVNGEGGNDILEAVHVSTTFL